MSHKIRATVPTIDSCQVDQHSIVVDALKVPTSWLMGDTSSLTNYPFGEEVLGSSRRIRPSRLASSQGTGTIYFGNPIFAPSDPTQEWVIVYQGAGRQAAVEEEDAGTAFVPKKVRTVNARVIERRRAIFKTAFVGEGTDEGAG